MITFVQGYLAHHCRNGFTSFLHGDLIHIGTNAQGSLPVIAPDHAETGYQLNVGHLSEGNRLLLVTRHD